MSPTLLLTAALMLAVGSSLDGHLLFLIGLPLTIAGFVVAWTSARERRTADNRDPLAPVCFWLSVAAAVGVVSPSTHGALWYEAARRAFSGIGIFLIGAFAGGTAVWQRRATAAAVVLGVALCLVTPLGTRNPQIDVFTWTQTSAKALLHGIQPYTVVAPDVYGGRYDPGYTLSVYPYMPATLLFFAPAVALLGDFRFALAFCLPLTIALVRAIGRRLSLDERLLRAAMLALVFHPAWPRVVESGWSEPLLVASAAAFTLLALQNPWGSGQAAAFFFLPALKQYVVAPALMYLARLHRAARIGPSILGAVVAGATVAAFLAWNWHATIDGIVFQMRAPRFPRLGSTSLVALIAKVTGVFPSRWLSVMAQLTIGLLAWLKLKDRGLAGLLLASALSLYATFLAGWQAFVNYYYFIGSLLLLAALVAGAEEVPA